MYWISRVLLTYTQHELEPIFISIFFLRDILTLSFINIYLFCHTITKKLRLRCFSFWYKYHSWHHAFVRCIISLPWKMESIISAGTGIFFLCFFINNDNHQRKMSLVSFSFVSGSLQGEYHLSFIALRNQYLLISWKWFSPG